LKTVEPQKGRFLTIDSGFPLPELEEGASRGKAPLPIPYQHLAVPLLFAQAGLDGSSEKKQRARRTTDLIDTLIHDPILARLYWGMARIDRETQSFFAPIRQALRGLYAVAARAGFLRKSHPHSFRTRPGFLGGTLAEAGWKDLVGVGSDSPGEFVVRLLSKDNGWLAAYFDSLSRVNQVQQAHFTEARRLRP